ncbi:prepilin-type N-terminal cleavage/methylation domain-containing protein [Celerinatantimonas diazotrophica]|uniref:Prepilin-type N-terminal cleavage/methylation domain-containing protein n=2 Tax=Celerinatantimonas diazotrophica TaxID=412034 RepID=A0A4R1J8W8_9GAMM|nr:prepilin-type N-terminal cleavage/methylation domain-containing protein [Celerinatantimonas diazotrophica]CAG9295813.1 hypothetical protein CEDIAZO_00940 [Celerinatantimonas diazotrophica]
MKQMQSRGYSLVEVMIALSLALLILAGGYHWYLNLLVQQQRIVQYANIRLRGEAAVNLIAYSITNTGSWAGLNDLFNEKTLVGLNQDLCQLAQLPVISDEDGFAAVIEAFAVPSNTSQMGCIGTHTHPLLSGSPVIQLRELTGPVTTKPDKGVIWQKTQSNGAVNYWAYQSEWFFLVHDGKKIGLMRLYADADGVKGATGGVLIQAITQLNMQFGLCSASGELTWVALSQMDRQSWVKVRMIHLGLLAQALNPDPSYLNTNQYTLAGKRVGPFNDHYRRIAFNQLVALSPGEGPC